MAVSERSSQAPWYRHVWPWLLMIPPASAVIGGFMTAYLAGGPPALVVDDYGTIAMATQQRVGRDNRARELGLTARLGLAQATATGEQAVHVELEQAESSGLPEQVVLQLVHPTRAEFDRETVLLRGTHGYQGRIHRPVGRLYVQLGDVPGTWRLLGELAARADTLELRHRPNPPNPGEIR